MQDAVKPFFLLFRTRFAISRRARAERRIEMMASGPSPIAAPACVAILHYEQPGSIACGSTHASVGAAAASAAPVDGFGSCIHSHPRDRL